MVAIIKPILPSIPSQIQALVHPNFLKLWLTFTFVRCVLIVEFLKNVVANTLTQLSAMEHEFKSSTVVLNKAHPIKIL